MVCKNREYIGFRVHRGFRLLCLPVARGGNIRTARVYTCQCLTILVFLFIMIPTCRNDHYTCTPGSGCVLDYLQHIDTRLVPPTVAFWRLISYYQNRYHSGREHSKTRNIATFHFQIRYQSGIIFWARNRYVPCSAMDTGFENRPIDIF